MPPIPQTHHGLHVADLAATKAALRAIGYTATQPGADEPIELRNVPEDPVGQQTAGVLGDRYITHFIENPATGHQIDLIEIDPRFLVPRLTREPMQGDLTIGVPMQDPRAAYAALRAADPRGGFSEPVDCPEEDGIRFFGVEGQDFVFTRGPAFAIAHYSTRDFPTTRRLFEEGYGVRVEEIASPRAGARRYAARGIGGRLEFEAADAARHRQRPVGLDRDLESARMQRLAERRIELQGRLAAGKHHVGRHARSFTRPGDPHRRHMRRERRRRIKPPAADAIGPDKVRVAEPTRRLRPIHLAPAPQIAPHKPAKDRGPPGARALALQGIERLFDDVPHR